MAGRLKRHPVFFCSSIFLTQFCSRKWKLFRWKDCFESYDWRVSDFCPEVSLLIEMIEPKKWCLFFARPVNSHMIIREPVRVTGMQQRDICVKSQVVIRIVLETWVRTVHTQWMVYFEVDWPYTELNPQRGLSITTRSFLFSFNHPRKAEAKKTLPMLPCLRILPKYVLEGRWYVRSGH